MKKLGLTFGIYPLSVAGTPVGLATGPADDFEKIVIAVNELKDKSKSFLPRTYAVFMGLESEEKVIAAIDRYIHTGILCDLTIRCLQDPAISLEYYFKFIRLVIQLYGTSLNSL